MSDLPTPYPFAAIVGQPELTRALLLAAVEPAIGGVLIEGPRGSAKSTAARALAALLAPAPFVTVPLGAALEHVTGTLDLDRALAGHALRFAPGLLARADGGVLYVDEINLLPDALVDVLLDAAASGVNVIERDGISQAHAARFVLVGTMNPEEGELRPQLLDRLGLAVRVADVSDAATRQAIVKARLAFDHDPVAFAAQYADAQARLGERLRRARARVADTDTLPLTDAVHDAVSRCCLAARVDGLRADLVMLRAARALAAWEEAAVVTPQHVAQVAELVLRHRRHPEAENAPPARPRAPPPEPGEGAGAPDDGAQNDWGEMPPEPVGLTAVKPLRPLRPPAAKKA
jgi:magnesium chelatase subunit I